MMIIQNWVTYQVVNPWSNTLVYIALGIMLIKHFMHAYFPKPACYAKPSCYMLKNVNVVVLNI